MDKIFERLRALEKLRKKDKNSSSALSTLVTGRQLPEMREQRKAGIEQFIPGEVRSNALGSYFHIVERFPADHKQGFQPLAADLPTNLLCRLATGEEELDCSSLHLAYLDTETTGLAGGSGTFAFLVGLGYWTEAGGEREFVVEQFFMRDYDEEPALLSALDERFQQEAFSALVTYNGRRFDVPLLTTRFITNRQRDRIAILPQIDLLYPVRQLWKLRFGDCSLSHIERQVLGVRRLEDVAGADIPSLYFQYVRGGDPRRLRPIFTHNLDDILSLTALTGRVLQQMSVASPDELDPVETYSLGRLHLRNGQIEQASLFLERSSHELLPFEVYLRSQRELSLAYKRRGQWNRAVEIWLQTVESLTTSAPGSEEGWSLGLFAFEELAKFFEHREKAFERSREFVLKAMEIADRLHRQETCERFQRRLERIEKKNRQEKVPRKKSVPCPWDMDNDEPDR